MLMLLTVTGCMVAQVPGAPAQDQPGTQSQTSQSKPSDQAPAAKSSAPSLPAPPATSGFPLDQFQEFSAIMVGSLLSGDERESHIYRSGNLLRTQGTEGLGYFLTDLASFETYALTRLGCTSDSHPFFRAFPFTAGRPGAQVRARRRCQRIGGRPYVSGRGHYYYRPRLAPADSVEVLGGRRSARLSDQSAGSEWRREGYNSIQRCCLGPVDPTTLRSSKAVSGWAAPTSGQEASGQEKAGCTSDR